MIATMSPALRRDLAVLPIAFPDVEDAIVAALAMLGASVEPVAYSIPLNGDGTSSRTVRRSIALAQGAGVAITGWGARVSTATGPTVFRPGVMVTLEPDGRAEARSDHQLGPPPVMRAPLFASRSINASVSLPASFSATNFIGTTGNAVNLTGYLIRDARVFNMLRTIFGEYFSRVLVPSASDPVSMTVPARRWRVDRLAYYEQEPGAARRFVVHLGDLQFPREAETIAVAVFPGVGPTWRGAKALTGAVRISPVHLVKDDLVSVDPFNAGASSESDGSTAFLHVQGAAW
jgi:hypothetical protein